MLRDRVLEDPVLFVGGCLVWVPIAIWVLMLLQWTIQGDVDVLIGLAGIAFALGTGFVALLAKDPRMGPALFIAALVTSAVIPMVRRSLNKRALDAIDVEAIEKSYQLMSERPGNGPAKFRLAKTIYPKGMQGHAIALAENALQQMPEALFTEEHRIVKGWRAYRIPPGSMAPLGCLDCGTLNEPGLTHCKRCGAPFLLDHARGKWIGRSLAKKLIASWIALIIALVGMPQAAQALPTTGAVVVIGILFLLCFGLVFLAFRKSGGPLSA